MRGIISSCVTSFPSIRSGITQNKNKNTSMEPTFIQILLLGLIQLIAQALEAVTGFGSTVIAVPFMAMLTDLDTAKAVGVTHTWLLVIYVIAVSWRKIVWKEFGFIVLYVLIGLPFGFLLYGKLDSTYLMGILAVFMIGVGINGIYTTQRSRRQAIVLTEPVNKSLLMRFILFLGGVIHGAFGTGGPLIVIYAAQALKDKTLFRTCLCLLWLCLNTVLLIQFTVSGVWTKNNSTPLYATVATLPFLFIGIMVGNYLHHRVSEYVFRLIMFALLLGTGLVVVGAEGSAFLAKFN